MRTTVDDACRSATWTRRHLLGLEDLEAAEILQVLDTAESMGEIMARDIKKVPTLRGRAVLTLFYEPSTRTRNSFELACKYLSADTVSVTAAQSSVVKGETLKDTALNCERMGIDAIVIRHPAAGAPHLLARAVRAAVINAGDGMHEHPTQGLLDLFTIRQKKGRIAGLRVAIVGDVLHSRVARSDAWGLTKLGAEVRLAGPLTLLPPGTAGDRVPGFPAGVRAFTMVEEALDGADVVIALRIQKERQDRGLFPSTSEYARFWGINRRRLALAAPDVLLMHPGPVNRGVELDSDVADGVHSSIYEQVANGVAVRMAVLYLLLGGER